MSAAVRWAHAAIYDAIRCPVHGYVVSMIDGRLTGQCDGCAAEAARALKRLAQMRGAA